MNARGVLKQLFSAYPNTQATEETVAMYVRLLGDIPEHELQVVVDQAVATSKFLPTIAELRDMRHSLAAAGRLTWVDGWEMVQREIRRIGSYGTPHFDDDLTAQVVRTMGWRELCASENQVADRAQFRDMYQALATRADTTQKLLPHVRTAVARVTGSGRGLLTDGGNNASH